MASGISHMLMGPVPGISVVFMGAAPITFDGAASRTEPIEAVVASPSQLRLDDLLAVTLNWESMYQ